MDALISEAIAVAGTLAGACIGVGGTVAVTRRERHHLLNVRMRDAFGVFLGAIYQAVADLRELPDINELPIGAGTSKSPIGGRRQWRAESGDA